MTHTHSKDNKSESDTSCLCVYISDKQNSKALVDSWDCWDLTLSPTRAGDERLHTDSRSVNTWFR